MTDLLARAWRGEEVTSAGSLGSEIEPSSERMFCSINDLDQQPTAATRLFLLRPSPLRWTQQSYNTQALPQRLASFALAEIRRRTDLTLDQIGELVGVKRRALHLWAHGAPVRTSNLQQLTRLVGVIRHLDKGDPKATTELILSPGRGGSSSWFEALSHSLTTKPRAREKKRPPRLSSEVRARRRDYAYTELLGGPSTEMPIVGSALEPIPAPPMVTK